MNYIVLGKGHYAVASSHRIDDGMPALTFKRLDRRAVVGTLLEGEQHPAEDYHTIICVESPEAAKVLLTAVTAIAFHHGVKL